MSIYSLESQISPEGWQRGRAHGGDENAFCGVLCESHAANSNRFLDFIRCGDPPAWACVTSVRIPAGLSKRTR